MKKLTKIITVCLVVLMAFTLMACSSYKRVERAFTDAGYKVIESNENAEQMESESDRVINTHILSNASKATIVIIFEFKATEDLVEFYKESETAQGFVQDVLESEDAKEFYNNLVEEGYAKGNCLMIPIGFDVLGAKKIMRNA